jgi:hypothetical protein
MRKARLKHALSLSNWGLKNKKPSRESTKKILACRIKVAGGRLSRRRASAFLSSLGCSYEVDEQQRALLGLYEAFGPVEVAQRAAHNETHIS